MREPDVERLAKLAWHVGRDWQGSPPYYDLAEADIDTQWQNLIWPFITTASGPPIDFSVTVDLAAGHGRNSTKLLPLAQKLHIVDINEDNISFMRARFGTDRRIEYHLTDGYSLPFLDDRSVCFIYCFDAMVHFDSDVVRAYLSEIKRVLRPGGHAFLHHSNYSDNPGGDLHQNPGWRNFMSAELFAHYAIKSGLMVVRQMVLDWLLDKTFIDCLSLLSISDQPSAE